MRALLLIALLASHLVGPDDRPTITIQCHEIRAMRLRLELIRATAIDTPGTRARADRLLAWLKFYRRHECQNI